MGYNRLLAKILNSRTNLKVFVVRAAGLRQGVAANSIRP